MNLEGKNILVVEDDDMNFIYLKQIFKITKGNVVRAKTGNTAIELCQSNSYDLILMDLKLPDITGYDATSEIRKINANVPIVAQTAARTPSETDEALEAGCNKVLHKPFKFEELVEAISGLL